MTGGLTPRKPPWQLCVGLGAAASLTLLTACAGGGGAVGGTSTTTGASASAGAASGTLTIAVTGPPVSMDPSHADNGNGLYPMELAYEPLIWESDDGSLTPGLATSWKYVGTGNKEFQLTIRSGAKFSDGEPVTAEAVAASLNYFPKGSGPSTADLAGVTRALHGKAEELQRWWHDVAAMLQPLENILAQNESPLADLVATHLQAAEALSCGRDTICLLWSNTDGAAAATASA